MNPYPNYGPPQPYPPQRFLDSLKAISTKTKLLIGGAIAAVVVVFVVVLAGGRTATARLRSWTSCMTRPSTNPAATPQNCRSAGRSAAC